MQLEKTSHWLMISGNLGLLIGVALVIVQINQNSELVREQLDSSRWTDEMNLHLAMMGENPAAAVATAIENPLALSLEDSRVLEAYLSYWALAKVRTITMYERGMTIAPPSTFTPDSPTIHLDIRVLGNAYAKARFDEFGLGPHLTPRLRGLMDSLAGNEAWNEFERVTTRIKESQ